MEKRDLRSDLELCEKATSGAWESSPAGNWYGAEPNYFDVSSDYATIADLISNKDDARFIAQAREALPYWLKRVQELEAQVAALRQAIESLKFIPDCGGDWCYLVDDTAPEPDDEPLYDCEHKGYCKTFVEIERMRDKVLSSTAGKELLERVRKLEAVAEAARELSKYDDFSQPSYCPKCGPIYPGRYNAAREKFYDALAALDGDK